MLAIMDRKGLLKVEKGGHPPIIRFSMNTSIFSLNLKCKIKHELI